MGWAGWSWWGWMTWGPLGYWRGGGGVGLGDRGGRGGGGGGGVRGGDHAAYVMYTSGSTGVPKGVVVTHRGVDRLVRQGGFVELGGGDVVALVLSVSFDAATFEIWGALVCGAAVAVAPAGVLSLSELGGVLSAHGVSVLWLTAGFFHQVVDADAGVLGGLRYLLAGGDVLSARHCRVVLEQVASVRLVNGYGPTENTTFTATHLLGLADVERGGGVPIGRPVGGTRVFVLDEWLCPVAAGGAGGVCGGGGGAGGGLGGGGGGAGGAFCGVPVRAGGGADVPTGDLAKW